MDFFSLAFSSSMVGATAIFWRLVPGRVSRAPDLMKFSRVRLFTSFMLMRPTKSSMERKGPFLSLSARITSVTGLPTLLMADRP